MKELLDTIVKNPQLHSKWINTLSMMENTGAKKIKKCEHPVFVSEMILKHAAEEARHAYYLKKQIKKVLDNECKTYERKNLLAPAQSSAYLQSLDISLCRYLRDEFNLEGAKLKYAAYLLVTYAIEVRADMLYPIYQEVLTKNGSKVNVKSIIAEEENHLKEMRSQIAEFFDGGEKVCAASWDLENELFNDWIQALTKEIS